MQVGIKLWSSNPVKYVKDSDFADFIEVLPRSEKSLEKFARRPHNYTVHVPHEALGFCPLLDMKKSRELLEHAIKAAKKLKTETLIMHTGRVKEEPNDEFIREAIKAAAKLAKTASYGRILIENSYQRSAFAIDKGNYYFCYDYEHIKELLEMTGAGFCLDFEHTAIAAVQLGLDYKRYLAKLMRLKPEYFHLSGSRLASGGHHISIFDSDIDLSYIKSLVKKADKPVCLETPIGIAQRKKEVEFLKS